MDKNKCSKVEDLNHNSVVNVLEKWELFEFVDFVKERQIDGRKLLDVTEGIVKLWQPKVNAKKFILFIEDFKVNPEKYLSGIKEMKLQEKEMATSNSTEIKVAASIESQYQTVKKNKIEPTASFTNVEELLKKLVPAKSFLYRNQQKKPDKTIPSYVPMDGTRKPKKFFRLSSYEYPNFDLLSIFSKQENVEDRGYYSVKSNTRYYIQKTYRRQDSRTKYKSLQTPAELNDLPEDHFYEDLCYNDMPNVEENKTNSLNRASNVKPCLVKIQELFQSFKMPFTKKHEALESDLKTEEMEKGKDANVYENAESVCNMYDSVHVKLPSEVEEKENNQAKLPVEEYLEPVQVSKDYCDVALRQKDDSLLGYIMSIFDSRFGFRRETSDPNQSDESDPEDEKPCERNACADARPDRNKMADRPLPVPVENEPYYMNVDRTEAENLLKGQPDGVFILRPSSQPNHAYTLSVSCSNAVHNVGVRRRHDGRLALGYARKGERSFASVPSLLRHHKRRRLLLVAAGGVIGATTLNETPHYYQIPRNIPVT